MYRSFFMVLDKVVGTTQQRLHSSAWKNMNNTERLLVLKE